ncbi:MAG: nucleotidyltransferase domain-containing protein [Rhodoferax sp.]|nr:nucleotidyltransferase domain-containing protein [Rhodoferax sp.]
MIDLAQDQLRQVRAIVRRHVKGGEIFVFGSRARSGARKFSDLDLMIKVPGGVDWRTLADLRESLEASDLPIMVDVVDWDACSDRFRALVAAQLVRIA